MRKTSVALLVCFAVAGLYGCSPAVVGAGAAGGAYEYQNKQQLDKLEEQFQKGEITREEYEQKKEAIEGGSLVY